MVGKRAIFASYFVSGCAARSPYVQYVSLCCSPLSRISSKIARFVVESASFGFCAPSKIEADMDLVVVKTGDFI